MPSLTDVLMSEEMRVVSWTTPLSGVAYPGLTRLVAWLLHDNPPNTTVLSYYLSTIGLLFGFAVSTTSYFLYAQQTDLYSAIYAEASSLNTLLEECACALTPEDAAVVASEVMRYLSDGVWAHEEDLLPAEALASEILYSEDAINRIARHLLTVEPVSSRIDLSEAVRGVRLTSTKRLASLQTKVPELQLSIVRLLAGLVLFIFPLTHATSGGDGIETGFEALLFSNLAGVVTVTTAIIDDLYQPHSGLFNVNGVRATLQVLLPSHALPYGG
jgi:hypothetical protein